MHGPVPGSRHDRSARLTGRGLSASLLGKFLIQGCHLLLHLLQLPPIPCFSLISRLHHTPQACHTLSLCMHKYT